MGFKEIKTGVLVVRSGLAGVMAALKVARMGCKLVLTRNVSMRSRNSALSNGGWLVPSKYFPQRDDDQWLKNIILTLDRGTGDFIVSYRPIQGL